ncbi:DIP1984 family protein [Clostridium sp. MSJ-11]|uniref:DIP1984 family protein n=1 Tax=Clostridium mobile TaxID=2841512 RepID=A0ABS6EGF6_9CLOT|nr:DIP1984 family protein [Clostridium mobile]MBU5483791.1 DIP1984 family protein [Clostridium mobile]
MKLAEALILRSDYQKRIEQLKNRLTNNAKVQEGDEPMESPDLLLQELDRCLYEVTDIIKRINKTNSQTKFNDSMSLADALAERERIWDKRLILTHLVEAATVRQDRYSRSEVKFSITINVREIQKKIDELSKEFRLLDTKIQGMNWNIDLL